MFSGRAPKPLVFATLVTVMLAAVRLAAQTPVQDHPEQYSPADVAAGLRVYNAVCVSCHGPNGAGVGNIDLRRGPLPRAGTDAALRALITNGIPGSGMPPIQLDPSDLRTLVAYIRAGFDTNPTAAAFLPGDPGRGRMFFEGGGNCLNCHRVHDQGEYSGPDLTEIGLTRSAAALQRSLLDPTGGMRPINRPVRAVTKAGTIIIGRRLNEDTYTVQLVNDRGRLVSLVKAELREWVVSTTSPMPSLKDSLTPEAFADLVAYLVSLKGSRPQ